MKVTIENIAWEPEQQAAALGFMNGLFDDLRSYKQATGNRVKVAMGENITIHGFNVDMSEFDVIGDEGTEKLMKAVMVLKTKRSESATLS